MHFCHSVPMPEAWRVDSENLLEKCPKVDCSVKNVKRDGQSIGEMK